MMLNGDQGDAWTGLATDVVARASVFTQLLGQMTPVIGPKATSVIGCWMGGMPTKSLPAQVASEFNVTDILIPFKGMAKAAAIGAGLTWGYIKGGHLPTATVASANPGGPSLAEAMGDLKQKNPQLYQQVKSFGEGHRVQIVQQIQASTSATHLAKQAAIDAYNAAAPDLGLPDASQIGTLLILAMVAAGGYAAWRVYTVRRAFS